MTYQHKPERGSPAGIGFRLRNRRLALALFFAAVAVIAAAMYIVFIGLSTGPA